MSKYQGRKPVLEITDGTPENTINLLQRSNGYLLCDWHPQRPKMNFNLKKNWFTGMQVPAAVVMEQVIDTLTLNARGVDQDTLIAFEQKLSRILFLAVEYWSAPPGPERLPFYIVTKALGETNERYAIIFTAQFHESNNPFSQPFASHKPADINLVVPVGHSLWANHPPTMTGSLPSDYTANYDNIAAGTLDGLSTGAEHTCMPVCFSNYSTPGKLTYISREGHSGNLLDEFSPGCSTDFVTLFSPQISYALFGFEQNIWDVRGFYNIVFNIDNVFSEQGDPIIWEYWSGTTDDWEVLDVADGTNNLVNSGMVSWQMPEDWVPTLTQEPSGATGYIWIKANNYTFVNPVTTGLYAHAPYSTTGPFFTYRSPDSSARHGIELDFSIKKKLLGQDGIGTADRIIIGARSGARIKDVFASYIFPENNTVPGISFIDGSTVVDSPLGINGKARRAMIASGKYAALPAYSKHLVARMFIDQAYAEAYSGVFKLYLRVSSSPGQGQLSKVRFHAEVSSGEEVNNYPIQKTNSATSGLIEEDALSLVSFGSISLSGSVITRQVIEFKSNYLDKIEDGTSGDRYIDVHDIILIPQDEWFGEFQYSELVWTADDLLKIKTASSHGNLFAGIYDINLGTPKQVVKFFPGNPLFFNHVQDIRFYTLSYNSNGGKSDPYIYYEVSEMANKKIYLGARGKI